MGFFKRHQGRGSYDLFSNYSHYLPGFGGMLGLFALFILGSLLGSLVSGLFVMLMGSSEVVSQYSMLIAYPVSFIPPLLYASAQSRRNEYFETGYALDSNNFGVRGGFSMAAIVSVATLAAAFVCEPLSAALPDMPEHLEKALELLVDGPLWVSLLSVSIFAPLFEEWLCRGLVLRGLMKHMNPTGAICVSAAFFAILHMNPWQALPAFILGLLFGYVYYRTGSLKLTMLMHCVNNTFAVIFSKIPAYAEAECFLDVMRPWTYVCIFIACAAFTWGAVVTLRSIPLKNEEARCNCDEVDATMSI